MPVAIQLPLFNTPDTPDVELETFWSAREILEGLQIDLDEETYGADLALVWCLVNDSCKAIHGQGVG
jgi:hypothetical protein